MGIPCHEHGVLPGRRQDQGKIRWAQQPGGILSWKVRDSEPAGCGRVEETFEKIKGYFYLCLSTQ